MDRVNLELAIHNLALARQDEDAALAKKRTLKTEFEKRADVLLAFGNAKLTEGTTEEAQKIVRDLALEDYKETKDPHPHEAVEVQKQTVVEVLDEAKLLEWCKINLAAAIVTTMNMDIVIDVAKVGAIPPEIVKVSKEPKVLISKDLSKYR